MESNCLPCNVEYGLYCFFVFDFFSLMFLYFFSSPEKNHKPSMSNYSRKNGKINTFHKQLNGIVGASKGKNIGQSGRKIKNVLMLSVLTVATSKSFVCDHCTTTKHRKQYGIFQTLFVLFI